MFYEVDFDEETRIMFEGQASGAIAKGGGQNAFIPDHALNNSLDLINKIAAKIAHEVAPNIDGTYCAMDITFGVRADGNGVVMVAQDPGVGQFRVTIKRPIVKRTPSAGGVPATTR